MSPNRGTLELEKKTKDAEKLPTQYESVGKRKETPGGRPVHEIRIEGSRAMKPTNLSQFRENDRHDYLVVNIKRLLGNNGGQPA